MPKNFLWGRTVGHLKVTLLIIENCGIFLCSQRAALLIHTAYAVLFLGCVGEKNRRADLHRYVNFVFIKPLSRHPKTPQVFYWAYILIAHVRL